MIKELALVIPGADPIHFQPVAGMPSGGPDFLSNIIQWAITSLMIIATLLSISFLIFGGIKWTSSGGDKTALENARKMITWAIVGLVITFSSFLIITTVGQFFGLKHIIH
jgi:hypothetical protein